VDSRIKEDVLKALGDAINALKGNDYSELTRISDHTTHNISIYQDTDSLSTAILIYSLSKIVQRCSETSCPIPQFVPVLQKAYDGLEADKFGAFNRAYEEAFELIKSHDARLKMYIEEVLSKARVKKGQKLAQHGLSLSRISDMLGISQWELQSYVGKTVTEDFNERKMPAIRRLKMAREMFS
jgi:hypothetical protein